MKRYCSWWLLLLISFYGYCEEDEVTVTDEVEENTTIFIPTNQWQQILPGQAVPAGLHVRINLETGEKEAKLIEEESDEDNIKDKRRIHHYGYSDRRGIINKQTKAFKMEELLGDENEDDNGDIKLLTHDMTSVDGVGNTHDDTSTPHSDAENGKESYKLVTEDVRQMMKLVDILRDNTSESEELIFALSELEYLVHQIDNARDLDDIGGLKLVVFLLEHTNDSVQCNAAHVIGAAAQSNQVVQEACIRYGALGYLTAIIDTSDKLELLYRRTMYALSSLLRLNSEALHSFTFLHNGFDIIIKAQLMQRSDRYHLKVVTLIVDLLSEEATRCSLSGDNDSRWLLDHLTSSGWCTMISYLLPTNCMEQGFLLCEAVVKAMLLLENCDYTKSVELLEKVKEQFSHRENDDVYSEAYHDLVKLLHRTTED